MCTGWRGGGHSNSGQSVLWRKYGFQAWDFGDSGWGKQQVLATGKEILGFLFLTQDRKQEEQDMGT